MSNSSADHSGTRTTRQYELTAFDEELREANRRLLVVGLNVQQEAEQFDRDRNEIKALIGGLAEGVVVFDERGAIELLNPAARLILGFDPEDSHGGALWDLSFRALDGRILPPEDHPALRARTGATFTEEELLVSTRAGVRRLHLSANSIRHRHGEVVRAILTCRDVTHQRELERLHQDYTALISHDLRSPLSVVLGFARRLGANALRTADSDLAKGLALIESSAERMDRLIGDLLESALLESGEFQVGDEPVALLPLIKSVATRVLWAEETDRVRIVVPPQALPPIHGDAARIERVITNLLTNALKYSGPSSTVEITVDTRGSEVVTAMRDEGVGISAADLPHVFERFHRVGGKAGGSSYGLGLYIARLIAEAHGGRLWAESEPGVGSTFSFALPVQ